MLNKFFVLINPNRYKQIGICKLKKNISETAKYIAP